MRLSHVGKGLALAAGLAVTLVVMPVIPAGAAPAQDLAKWVNPFVGTRPGGADQGTGGGAGNTFPGTVVPFGMVQWSPDTVTEQHGGYYYDSTALKGFSLTHLSGAGCDTYEDIPFIPYTGEVTTSPASDPGRRDPAFDRLGRTAARLRHRDRGVATAKPVPTAAATTPVAAAGLCARHVALRPRTW